MDFLHTFLGSTNPSYNVLVLSIFIIALSAFSTKAPGLDGDSLFFSVDMVIDEISTPLLIKTTYVCVCY